MAKVRPKLPPRTRALIFSGTYTVVLVGEEAFVLVVARDPEPLACVICAPDEADVRVDSNEDADDELA
jgi:hypothetical protein